MENEWEERRLSNVARDKDVRTEWYRDYARIIHSSAFRRLQAKTQVLGLGESDFYRTRLTHSMEVAQIGVGICMYLTSAYRESEYSDILPSTDLMSAICLAHDIGHPPFGHGGEVALNVCMRNYNGFEGNGQTLRILSKLEKYSAHHGLNPTRRTMLGVLKYPVKYSNAVNLQVYSGKENLGVNKGLAAVKPTWLFKAKEQKPPKCYHDSEQDVVDWILAPLQNDIAEFTSSAYPKDVNEIPNENKHKKPLHKGFDTSIMELADDISYGLHDLEDAISLGMIDLGKWNEHNSGHEDLFSACGRDSRLVAEKLFTKESYDRKSCIGDLVNLMITNVEIRQSKMSKTAHKFLRYNAYLKDEFAALRDHLHELVGRHVIQDVNVQHLEFKGQRVVVELFEVLASDPERFLPEGVKNKFRSENYNVRVICDFVAGMTDDYAARLYDKIFSPGKGSIFDRM